MNKQMNTDFAACKESMSSEHAEPRNIVFHKLSSAIHHFLSKRKEVT